MIVVHIIDVMKYYAIGDKMVSITYIFNGVCKLYRFLNRINIVILLKNLSF